MRALTLHRPWPWLIFHAPADEGAGPKRIENRDWAPPAMVINQRVAFHAGQHFDHGVIGWALANVRILVPRMDDALDGDQLALAHPEGAIVGTAVVYGYVFEHPEIGAIRWSGCTEEHALNVYGGPYWLGPYAWLLRDVHTLRSPVRHRGAQGLWVVQASAAREIAAQIAKSA